MQLFDSLIKEVRDYILRNRDQGRVKELMLQDAVSWPEAGKRDIVLRSDTGVELGNPKDESVSFTT